MKKQFNELENCEVVVKVTENVIKMTFDNGQKFVFEANKENYVIDYNVASLGGGVCRDKDGSFFCVNQSSCNFENGKTYKLSELVYSTDIIGKTTISYGKYFHEVFIELYDDDCKFCDIILQSNDITARQNGKLLVKKQRRIFAGYYNRYDGFPFIVVDVIPNLETGKETVICRGESRKLKDNPYFVLTREEFCAEIEVDGKLVQKYSRMTGREKLSERAIYAIIEDGYRAPIRHIKKIDKIHEMRQSRTYQAYAKDLCDWYKHDYEYYKRCKEMKSYIGVKSSRNFKIMAEDLSFLHTCLKTTLSEFAGYFMERFKEKKSIRQYAKDHNINRGSVDYIQKKFITELAKSLEERDKADGVKRIIG